MTSSFGECRGGEVVPSGHTQPVEAGFVPSFLHLGQLTVSIFLWTAESEEPHHACCHGEGVIRGSAVISVHTTHLEGTWVVEESARWAKGLGAAGQASVCPHQTAYKTSPAGHHLGDTISSMALALHVPTVPGSSKVRGC